MLVRLLAPVTAGELPGAEIVAFSLDPTSTTQVELQLKVPIRLQGDRWELELPGRGDERTGLARDRRIIVKATAHGIDGAQQIGRDRTLEHEGVGAGLHHRITHALLVVDAEHDHLEFGACRPR